MQQNTRGAWRAVVALLPALALAGCAAMAPKTPEQAVTERAKARWEAILGGRIGEAYEYYSPGFRSDFSATALAQKIGTQRVRWQGAEFQGVSCEPDLCHPKFAVTYKYRMKVQGVGVVTNTRTITEDWIRADGEWFYVPPSGRK